MNLFIDENKRYLGVITSRKLMYSIAKSATIQSPGGVIILEMHNDDNQIKGIGLIKNYVINMRK